VPFGLVVAGQRPAPGGERGVVRVAHLPPGKHRELEFRQLVVGVVQRQGVAVAVSRRDDETDDRLVLVRPERRTAVSRFQPRRRRAVQVDQAVAERVADAAPG
jgi:hypothetical protein